MRQLIRRPAPGRALRGPSLRWSRQNDLVTEIPQRRGARTAKLASLPLGVAGRATLGLGKRIAGRSADDVNAELQARTAEQLFTVLGELKGGAMKLGQALSVFEAALPEESAAPYREALTKLQEAAPPMPAATVHQVLDEQFGRSWRSGSGPSTTRRPPRPASARCTARSGPTAARSRSSCSTRAPAPALMADLTQLSRLARLFGALSPGLDVKPLLAELKARVLEELDYPSRPTRSAPSPRRSPTTRDIAVPRVVASAPKAMVTEWIDGTPLSRIIAGGSTGRARPGRHAARPAALLGAGRAGLLHADPHPGNFRMLPDGRLGVVDFGAVARLPGGYPPAARPADPARRRRRRRTRCWP